MRIVPGLLACVFSGSALAQVQTTSGHESALKFEASESASESWSAAGLKLKKPTGEVSAEKLRLLETAAAANDPDALMQLAAMAASPMDTFGFVKRAAELGNNQAEYELAAMYAQGRGTGVDMGKAMTLLQEASRKGHREAQCELGILLVRRASRSEQLEGIEWLQKSSDAGLSRSALNLAKVFATGEFGVPVDEARAEALLKPYALKDDPECQFALASLYAQGTTFKDQRELARHWLKRSAELGHSEAARILGTLEVPAPNSQARP